MPGTTICHYKLGPFASVREMEALQKENAHLREALQRICDYKQPSPGEAMQAMALDALARRG